MLFDTHAHLNFKDYNKDREEIIKKSLEEGVFMINVGTDIEESKKAVEIANSYREGVYASVGLHPLHISNVAGSDPAMKRYEELAESEKVVAIGETGLDYKYILKEKREKRERLKKNQKKVFENHIDLADELNLPLILHCRMAHDDLIEVLKHKTQKEKNTKHKLQITNKTQNTKHKAQNQKEQNTNSKAQKKGVVHCFSGNLQQAKEYMDLGFYLGINGIIFKMDLEKVIKEVPLEKILLETDCPFLTPPEAGVKRNEPLFVKYVAKEVARIKGISKEEVTKVTTENAKNLFKLV